MRTTILFLLLSSITFGQTAVSSNSKADVKTIVAMYNRNGKTVSEELQALYPVVRILGIDYVPFVTKKSNSFNREDLTLSGIIVGSEIKDIVSIKYPISQLDEIVTNHHFAQVQISDKVRPYLDKVPFATRVDSVWMGYGLPQGYTGKDVIIGVTDWGFDYTSPMFYDTLLQNTRILAAWDQFKTSGPAPVGYSYGTEYNTPAELIAAGSDTANIYSYHTHATHVSGIAGGSGAGTIYRGIGFESEFLFTTFLVDESAVLDAWEWMYNKATVAGKRLVINMSWGLYHMNANDGTSLLSQALDAYSDLGVVFTTSAGNNGGVNFHIDKTYANDTLLTKVDFYSNASLGTVWGQSIHMWGEPGSEFSSRIRILDASNLLLSQSEWYSTGATTAYIDTFIIVNTTDTIWYNVSAESLHPTNGRPQMRLRIKYPPTPYKIVLESTAVTGIVHYWNVTELTNDVGNWGMPFTSIGPEYTYGDDSYGIGIPACTNSAISVAAYSSEYLTPLGTLVSGNIANFSSIGPLITGELKPDITAPGVGVGSSISSFTNASYNPFTSVFFNGRTYPFAKFNGTSMSSPATAGVIALILQANPFLSAQQVKQIIIATARQDLNTGIIGPSGDYQWGWGKLNAYAAVQLALNTIGLMDHKAETKWRIFPNPSTNSISILGIENDVKYLQIINQNGEIVMNPEKANSINIETLNNGVYYMRLVYHGKVEQHKFIKN